MRPITHEDLDRFRQFVMERSAQDSELTLGDLAKEFDAIREAEIEVEETVAAVNQGVKEFEEGKALPVDEAFAEIRRELGWPAQDKMDQ